MQVPLRPVRVNTRRIRSRPGYPAGGLVFDWMAAALSLLFALGMYLDAWAHNHGRVDQSFFTPWHAVLYGAFGLSGALFVSALGRNRGRGYPWRRAMPHGYGRSVVGVGVFALAGVADMVWHTLFGVEADVGAILSPSHLALAVGIVLICGGPLRAAWQRIPARSAPGWYQLGPAIVSLTLVLMILSAFTIFVHPLADTFAAPNPALTALADAPQNRTLSQSGQQTVLVMAESLGVAGIVIQSALMMGGVLLAVGRWQLPVGALTLMVALPSAFMATQHDHYAVLVGAVVAGLIADGLRWRLQPAPDRPQQFYVFAFTMPVIFYALYYAALGMTGGLTWTVHLVAGSLVVAGIVGLLTGFLCLAPLSADPAENART